jgi:hypothetical protein
MSGCQGQNADLLADLRSAERTQPLAARSCEATPRLSQVEACEVQPGRRPPVDRLERQAARFEAEACMGTPYSAVIGSVLFVLSVCSFPTGVVGRLRARAFR